MAPDKINIAAKLALFSEHWAPRVVADVDDYHVKLAKLKGDFVWHEHDDEDELFLVVRGRLAIAFRDRTVTLEAGEFLVVPRGVEHKPSAEEECEIMLLERKTVINTGDAGGPMTVAAPERI